MRKGIRLAVVLMAMGVFANCCRAEAMSRHYYFSTTLGQFLQSCEKKDAWCRSVIVPRIDSEAFRFCVPADHRSAAKTVLTWFRAHQNDTWVDKTSGASTPAAKEYLAKAVRTAMAAVWGEMGAACPFPAAQEAHERTQASTQAATEATPEARAKEEDDKDGEEATVGAMLGL